MLLNQAITPAALREMDYDELDALAEEIRAFIVEAVTTHGGHLGSNLGAVELTIALHRVFNSPTDAIIWDTGHQAYVHKIVTGRSQLFEE
ncbi:MAG: 1-deoxy-D-xylulose-5-phosphate synthase, partial [bacterium]|nr:1-deoxy-D-xylulose-5-phosphate synthase [bacterium]